MATYPTYVESQKDYLWKTLVHMLVIWSEIADTHFMLEIHAYAEIKNVADAAHPVCKYFELVYNFRL